MANVLDFEAGTDTGEADADSILPFANGENLNQITLSRSEQILRGRVEKLRAEANENRWVRDADRAMAMQVEGGTLTWGGTVAGGGSGTLVLSAGTLTVTPMTTPGSARGADHEGVGTTFPSRYAYNQFADIASDIFRVTSKLLQSGGGDTITFEVVENVGNGAVSVEVLGEATVPNPATQPGARKIVVSYDPAESEVWADVVTAIEAHVAADALVTIDYTPGGGDHSLFDVAEFSLDYAGDGIFHEITSAALASFFAAADANKLLEGDTLAIWYDTPQARRESTEEAAEHLIPAGSLVNLGREPEKAPHAVILGRVVDDAFVTPTGVALAKDAVRAAGALATGDASTISTTQTSWSEFSGANVQAALDDIDDVMAATAATITSNAGIAAAATAAAVVTAAADTDALRADINRGLSAPPAEGAGGSEGADYVGIANDGSTYDTIGAATESVAQALIDLDDEFDAVHGALAPSGTGTSRIESLAESYEQLGQADDALSSTLAAMYARLRTYDNLQELIEASPVERGGMVTDAKPTPLMLARPCRVAGTFTSVVDASGGDWDSHSEADRMSADGRFLVHKLNATTLRVRNNSDDTLAYTITTPDSEIITAFASDGFNLAVAFDSRIRMYNLDDGTLDTDWATAGEWKHSDTTNDDIVGLRFLGAGLVYAAAQADGSGDAAIGASIVILGTNDGDLEDQGGPAQDITTMDAWGAHIVVRYASTGGGVVQVYRVNNLSSPCGGAPFTSWNAVHSVAVNKSGVAISGFENDATDPQVVFLTHNGSVMSAPVGEFLHGLAADTYEITDLTRTDEVFFVAISSTTSSIAYFYGLRVQGPNDATDNIARVDPLWSFTRSLAAGADRWYGGMACDGVHLFGCKRSTTNAEQEVVERYEIGVGGGQFAVTPTFGDYATLRPLLPVPLSLISLYDY